MRAGFLVAMVMHLVFSKREVCVRVEGVCRCSSCWRGDSLTGTLTCSGPERRRSGTAESGRAGRICHSSM